MLDMKKRYLIMCVGFTHSGKTTFAQKLKKKNKNLVIIDNDNIANFINEEYKEIVFSSFNFEKKNYRDPGLKFHLSKEILIFALKAKLNIIHASGNLGRDAQKFIEKSAKKYSYKLITVYFNFPENFILSRIRVTTKSKKCFRLSWDWHDVLKKQKIYAQLPPCSTDMYFEIKNIKDYNKTLKKLALILK